MKIQCNEKISNRYKAHKELIINELGKKCFELNQYDLENNKNKIKEEILKSIKLLIKNSYSFIVPNTSKESIVTTWVFLYTHFKGQRPYYLKDVNDFILTFKDKSKSIKNYLIKDSALYKGEKYFKEVCTFIDALNVGANLTNCKLRYKNCIFAFDIKKINSYYDTKKINFGPKILQGIYPILNIYGMNVITNYYKEKYNIDIALHNVFSTSCVGNYDILKIIGVEFEKLNNDYLKGIIFWDNNHALPIILTKINNKKIIIFLDTNSVFLKNLSVSKNLLENFKQVEVWSPHCIQGRQADIYSCVTDAFVILKDLLRADLNIIFNNKIELRPEIYKAFSEQVIVFRMPELLLKTTQVSSYLEDSMANLNMIIGKNQKTLEQKRKENTLIQYSYYYDSTVVVKSYNRFAVNKTKKYLQIIEQYPK